MFPYSWEWVTDFILFNECVLPSQESDDNSDDEDDRETISSDSEDKNSQGASSSGSSGSSSQLQTVPEKTRDCDDQYFMSLAKLFKKLSSQKKADVRLKIERLLLEAEFQ